MDVREKLVELLQNAKAAMKSENLSCDIARNMFVVDFMMANGVTVQEWISVNDKMPEMGEHHQSEDVLVCIDYRPDDPDTTEDTYVSIDHVDFNCFGQGEFSCERDDPRGGEPSPYFVLHWMPIPQPPKGDNDAESVD